MSLAKLTGAATFSQMPNIVLEQLYQENQLQHQIDLQNDALTFINSDQWWCASCQDMCGIWEGFDDAMYNHCI